MKKPSLPAPNYFIKRACILGAKEAKVISPQQVFTAEWVRRKCQYGCDGYNEHLTCPPYSPTPQETRRMLDEYTTAILIHCYIIRGALIEIILFQVLDEFTNRFFRLVI